MKVKSIMTAIAVSAFVSISIGARTVHAADNGIDWRLHTATALGPTNSNWDFQVGDYNNDGTPDLYCIDKNNTGTKTTEVHVLDGKNNYKNFLLHTGTALGQTDSNWKFRLGDYNKDGIPDLYCILENSASGSTEVHILNGKDNFQSFLLHTKIPLGNTTSNWDFEVGDYNGDGIPDLYCIDQNNTGTKTTEVHILDGKSNYQNFSLHTGTALGETGSNWEFGVGDYNSDGIPDLYCIDKSGTGSRSTEVHVLDGSNNYGSFLLHTASPLGETGDNFKMLVGPGELNIYAVGENGTGSGNTELHMFGTNSNLFGDELVAYAETFRGVPYQWGGNGPNTFDCSGFTKYVFAHFGINLNRVASDQANQGNYISRENLLPGDLVFFQESGGIGHVGIYIGNGRFIDAPHTGTTVRIENSLYSNYSTARRIGY